MKKIYLFAFVVFSSLIASAQTFVQGTLPGTYRSGGVTGVWDMNNDGLNDIVVMDQSTTLRILYQQANGSFTQVNTATTPLGQAQWGMTVADIDNDGFGDVMCGGNYDGVHFYNIDENGNAQFVTNNMASIFMQACLFGDINNDGWLDAFACHDDGPSFMFRNDGAGTMIPDQTLIDYNLYQGNYPGTSDPLMSGNYGNEFCDFDRDGDMDLMVAKCRQASNDPLDPRRTNLLFVNDGNNNYTDDAQNRGLVNLQQSWTATFGDIDNDGDFDCFMTTHSGGIRMYENNGLGYFTDISQSSGLTTQGFFMQGQLADFDNDGYLDVLHAGGSFGYYHNNGNNTFTQMNNLIANPQTMHGFGLGDLNHDGFTDIYANYGNANGYVTPSNQADILWLSQPNGNHWVGFDLEGTISNKNAVGALVEIHGAFGTQIREIRSGVSYGITNSNLLVFGIGANTSIDYAVIHWPAGGTQVIVNPAIDQYHQHIETLCTNAPTVTISANGPTMICPGQTVELAAALVGTSNVIWSNGATSNSIVVSESGNYSAIAYDQSGCATSSEQISISVDDQTPPNIVLNGDMVFCQGSGTSLTASEGLSYLWSNGETTQTIEPTESGAYTVQVDAGCGLVSSLETISVEVLASPSISANDQQIDVSGNVDLTANSTGNISWYDANNNLVGTGSTFNTDVVSTTTYYVQATNEITGSVAEGGKIAQDAVNGQYSNSTFYLLFDANQDVIIDSVLVYAQTAGVRQIELVDNVGNQLTQTSVDVPAGASYISLNFSVPAGTGYGLRPVAGSQPGLWRDGNGSTQNFPYNVGNLVSITGTTVAAPNSYNYYYFFYDWHVSTPSYACTSPLQPVTVYVGTVLGCMDAAACNYNAIATETDNSCVYPGSPCDDQDPLTQNDVYTASCDCQGINGINDAEINLSNVSLFPNPGSSEFTIKYVAGHNEKLQIEVFSMTGQKVTSVAVIASTGENMIVVDAQNWSQGMYQIQVNGANGTYHMKWMKK